MIEFNLNLDHIPIVMKQGRGYYFGKMQIIYRNQILYDHHHSEMGLLFHDSQMPLEDMEGFDVNIDPDVNAIIVCEKHAMFYHLIKSNSIKSIQITINYRFSA